MWMHEGINSRKILGNETVAGKSDDVPGAQVARFTSLSISVGDISDAPIRDPSPHFSVTAALGYCKTRILKPYLRVLSVMGLRPAVYQPDASGVSNCLCNCYAINIVTFLLIGYILQYMTCFRRDRGFVYVNNTTRYDEEYEEICDGSLIFTYAIPNMLHFFGYLHACLVIRSADDDQLPSLMERVFLSSSNLTDSTQNQKKLIKILWIFISMSILWLVLSLISLLLMLYLGEIGMKWVYWPSVAVAMKFFLVFTTLLHDAVQITIVSNYCLQAQLLTSDLHFLRAKLLEHPIEPVDWMRDIQEFKKLLMFFNNCLAPSVCILTMINVASSISGFLWFFNFDPVDKNSDAVGQAQILNTFVWVIIAIAPFVQAARLTHACHYIKDVGHDVRIRPFVHQSTPGYELDSILLYISSLNMSAELFGIPINKKYIFLLITIGSFVLLISGHLHYLH